jgi:hypothetical protein
MAKIRFKKLKINWSKFFNYIFLIILSSALLLTFLIALPLTEKLTKVTAFDLNVADNFWSKEYILELESDNPSNIQKTRNILFKRLNDYNVEEVSVYKDEQQILRVVVKTTQPQSNVDELIKNPYRYSIVTRKEDVDFESEENQLAPYLAENYNETQFNANTFRNIYITQLPSSSGQDAYFGIVKPWIYNGKAFKEFLTEYEGQTVGVNIDGFVTPVQVNDSATFAIPLNIDMERLRILKILYNDGNIPTDYQVLEENELDVRSVSINYIEISLALFVSLILIYLYTYFSKIYNKSMVLESLFITLLSLALFLTFFKITTIPIHTFILLFDALLLIFISNILEQNDESRIYIFISTLIIGIIFSLLGIGYIKILANHLIIISGITLLSVTLGNYYISNISAYFKK